MNDRGFPTDLMKRLINIHESAAAVPAGERQYRTLTLPDFESILDTAGIFMR